MQRVTRMFAALALVTLAQGSLSLAHAQRQPQQQQYHKTQVVIFGDGDQVEGRLLRPDDQVIVSRDKARMGSLIKIRHSFVTEIVKSAERL